MSTVFDETHDPARGSWVEGADGHRDFPVQNLPFGVFSPVDGTARAGVAIGDHILDVAALASAGDLPEAGDLFAAPALNALLAAPAARRVAIRRRLSELLSEPRRRVAVEGRLHPAADCRLHLPARIGDYTDFYVGIHHAETIGRLFRPDSPLSPNYKHIPIGYHGRASSVRPSGVPVVRPNGQRRPPDSPAPSFGPCRNLDYELELGLWIGRGNLPGEPIPIAEAGEQVVGLCLLNDWSARDLQWWEAQPLGPFLAKSFQTTISPWIVTAEALAPFRTAQPARPRGDPEPLPYLRDSADQAGGSFRLQLEVRLSSARMRESGTEPHRVSRGTMAEAMYWTMAQIVAHHSSNGCDLHPGDLIGTGTLSAPDPDGAACLMELSRGGAQALTLPTGETRTFLEDGDEVSFSARAEAPGRIPIGFGPCRGVVLPAPPAP